MNIQKDYKKKPHLFKTEKVRPAELCGEIPEPPLDLIDFWTEIGAGEIFETETIYSPSCSIEENADTLYEINSLFQKRGLSPLLTVFHTGISISAYRKQTPYYVILDDSNFEITKCFNSIEEWYDKVIRAEYAERYGLA